MMTISIAINQKEIRKFYVHNLNGEELSTYEVYVVSSGLPQESQIPDCFVKHQRREGAVALAQKVLGAFQ